MKIGSGSWSVACGDGAAGGAGDGAGRAAPGRRVVYASSESRERGCPGRVRGLWGWLWVGAAVVAEVGEVKSRL